MREHKGKKQRDVLICSGKTAYKVNIVLRGCDSVQAVIFDEIEVKSFEVSSVQRIQSKLFYVVPISKAIPSKTVISSPEWAAKMIELRFKSSDGYRIEFL